jgi:hypothetical protein
MRDKWSLLVIVTTTNGMVSQQVIDFASPAWANTAYDNIKSAYIGSIEVIKLY